MRYLAKYLKPYRLQFIIGPAFKLLEAVLELFMPIMMALIIDKGIPAGDTGYILAVGGLMLLTASVGLGSAVICQYSASVASQGFGTAVRNALFKKVLSLSYAQVDRYGVQTLSNRITNDVTQLQTAVAMTIRLVIRAPFICIGSVAATLLIDWKLGLVVVCALPLFAAALFLVMRKSSPMYTKVQEGLDDMSDTLRENLSGVRVIRAFAREDAEKERFAGLLLGGVVLQGENLADPPEGGKGPGKEHHQIGHHNQHRQHLGHIADKGQNLSLAQIAGVHPDAAEPDDGDDGKVHNQVGHRI